MNNIYWNVFMYIVPNVLLRNGYAENQTFKIHYSFDFELSFIARRIFRCSKHTKYMQIYFYIESHVMLELWHMEETPGDINPD